MKTTTLCLAASLAIGGPALAAERAPAPHAPAPVCAPLDRLKADLDAKTHFSVLTAGQFLFVAGVYVGSPTTPQGMPPGDGAWLLTHDGSKDGKILWTNGKLGCSPIDIAEPIMKLLNAVKTGISVEDHSGDLRL